MKKMLLVLLMGLFLSTAAYADHPDGLGIGLILSGGYGIHGGGFYPGLSLKISEIPFFFGLYFHFSRDYFGIDLTGDYYLHKGNLISKTAENDDGSYDVKLDWHFGLGFLAGARFWNDKYSHGAGAGFDIGVRVPLGLHWHAIKDFFEVALGVAPTIGVYAGRGGASLLFSFPIELTLRFWL